MHHPQQNRPLRRAGVATNRGPQRRGPSDEEAVPVGTGPPRPVTHMEPSAVQQEVTTGKAVISHYRTRGHGEGHRCLLIAVGAAESGRPTVTFLTKEAVRLAVRGARPRARGATACTDCPALESHIERYAAAGGRYLVCPICVDAKRLTDAELVDEASKGGTVPMWEWIGRGWRDHLSY